MPEEAKKVSGALFFGFVQPPVLDSWDETWDDASDVFETGDIQLQELKAFLEARGVEWKTFGDEDNVFWHALSIKESEIEFGCERPQIIQMQDLQDKVVPEWVRKLLECAWKLRLNRGNLLAGWYIGTAHKQ